MSFSSVTVRSALSTLQQPCTSASERSPVSARPRAAHICTASARSAAEMGTCPQFYHYGWRDYKATDTPSVQRGSASCPRGTHAPERVSQASTYRTFFGPGATCRGSGKPQCSGHSLLVTLYRAVLRPELAALANSEMSLFGWRRSATVLTPSHPDPRPRGSFDERPFLAVDTEELRGQNKVRRPPEFI